MKINKFIASGVFGYLNYNINFNSDVTFLTGINGSGKTTALRIILGLLTPSFKVLTDIDFENVKLICSSKKAENNITIYAEKKNNRIIIRLNVDGQKEKKDIIDIDTNIRNDEEERLEYQRFKEREFYELNVVKEIMKINTPLFLGLDRRVLRISQTISPIRERERIRRVMPRTTFEQSALESLQDIQKYIFRFYTLLPEKQKNSIDRFKNKLFSMSFEYIDEINQKDFTFSKISMERRTEELSAKEETFKSAMRKINLQDTLTSIDDFFAKMKTLFSSLQNSNESSPINDIDKITSVYKYFANYPQLKRIDKIIKSSQEFQSEMAKFYEPTTKLTEIVNRFFSEIGKKLIVDQDGTLYVTLMDEDKRNSIFELSSGEKQILIMISHLLFSDHFQIPDIFIIDEPELSLHMSWQEIFVESLITANPNIQLILATHSPKIVSKIEWERKCIDLNDKSRRGYAKN